MQKYLLYKQFVAWNCNRCSTAPLTDYINLVHQELIDESDYNRVRSDESVYLDLRPSAGYTSEEKLERNDSKINLSIQLKNSATKILVLRVWAYLIGEYLYVPSRQGLALHHKAYSIAEEDDNFFE